ncbi:MAG: hypothetical protein KGZ74_06130 [Chitinophagaceae bacterium]|nr:hypothetical protein [Chitinophagaceae bacterium]
MKTSLPVLLLAVSLSVAAQKKPAVHALNNVVAEATGTTGDRSSGSGSFTVNTRRVFEIKIPEGGANGASVVYHPKEKLYYAAQAGNASFPLVIFDENGNVVSNSEQSTLIDIRGLWYNPKTKDIGGNGYAQFGWFSYELDKKGMVEKINVFKKGRYQPDDHSPGVLNTDDNEILFLDGLNIVCYTTEGDEKRKTIQLYIGKKTSSDAGTGSSFESDYNTRSLIYTGKNGSEIGLLNIVQKQVELYSIKTGYMTKIVKLPLSFKPEAFFNFSYSNDTYWVFNKTTRIWNGFREE